MGTRRCTLYDRGRHFQLSPRRSPPIALNDYLSSARKLSAQRTGAGNRIERAVSNLLDNAGKWSPAGGRVDVTVREGEVVVRDHGPGIAPEDVPLVFDRFWRAERARGTPGSGLGLAIVRQVADQHGATTTVETPADGGTRMRLRFPS